MIDIVRFREILLELRQRVNGKLGTPIAGVVMAVREGHMQKKLRDKEGIWLCANYPDAELIGEADSHKDKNSVLIFLLEKVPSGKNTDEDELQHYAGMQRIMNLLKTELLEMDFACDDLDADNGMLTEWEYDVFGGFNGLSVGLNLTDYD